MMLLHGYVPGTVYHVSDTPEESDIFFFREYWIRRLIRIGLVDTAQPNKTVPYPSIPDARASYARTPARPRLAPHPHAVMPHPRSPAASHLRQASARWR